MISSVSTHTHCSDNNISCYKFIIIILLKQKYDDIYSVSEYQYYVKLVKVRTKSQIYMISAHI